MSQQKKERSRAKRIHAGFLFSLCASIFFFGLFILYSFRKDLDEGGHYLEGVGIVVPPDISFALLVLGMVFLFIAFLLRFEIVRKKQI